MIRAVIADDEPAGRANVRALLADQADIDLITECVTGPETVRAVLDWHPDLLFLDVRMPGYSGIAALAEIPQAARPVVIFVTAYDEHALGAFELEAVDYLLKPFSDQRFHAALARARSRLEQRHLQGLRDRLLELADDVRAEPERSASARSHTDRLTVRTQSGLQVLRQRDIHWIEAAGDYARIHANESTFVIRSTMATLARRLDPQTFVRVHRSAIVNLDHVRELRLANPGEPEVVLRDGQRVRLSERGREILARALEPLRNS